MPEIEFAVPLDNAEFEWMRMRLTTVRGRVVTYTVQYETTLGDQRVPVVRFDNAHGFPHRDLLDRTGRIIEKRPIPGNPSPALALAQGELEIRTNSPRYRAAFFGEEA
jgi:hypothetical protein